MKRLFGAALLLSFAAGAAAQQAGAPASGPRPTPGEYSGSLQEWAGSRSSDVKLNIRHITADGRVTARVSANYTGIRKVCAKALPASGITLPDGTMRLEVDAGAPDGCERIYNVKAEGGSLSGTFIDAVRAGARQRAK